VAVTDVLSLWKLAATLMGQTANVDIVSATSPTKPIELTFDQIYDNIRIDALLRIMPEFAKKRDDLRLAPTEFPNGDPVDWLGDWTYAYRSPTDSLKFIGFQRDRYELNLVTNYKRERLPIQYDQTINVIGSPVYSWAERSVTNESWYRGSIFIDFMDEYGLTRRIEGYTLDGDDGSIGFRNAETGDDIAYVAGSYYPSAADSAFDVVLNAVEWNFPTPTYPVNIYIDYARLPDSESDWSSHLLCNISSAIGVYLYDVTDPSLWSPHFQTYVATEMALKAAGVHAKSTKVLERLREDRQIALSNAATQEAADDDSLEDQRMSTAEQARQ
jgi:hypothetical protein